MPELRTLLGAAQVMEELRTLSRRGKFPGFIERPGGGFTALLFGSPLDHELQGTVRDVESGSVLSFSIRMQRRIPIIFWAVMVLTVWPGVWMTDSMLRTYIPSYKFQTWLWYIPLTVVPLPWYWMKMLRNSRSAALSHAQELLQLIRQHVDVASSAKQSPPA